METGVYKITNIINGKIYIGSAAKNSFYYRWSMKYNKYLESSFKKCELAKEYNISAASMGKILLGQTYNEEI